VVIAALLAAVVAGVAAILVAGRITGPLQELRWHANQVASGHLEVAVEPATTRELREVGHAFNVMTERVRGLIGVSEQTRLRLAAIFANLTDGVILTDAEQRVITLNPAAGAMLDSAPDEARGQAFVVVARDHELANLLHMAMKDQRIRHGVVEYPRTKRILEATARRVEGANEDLGVVVVRDITDLRRLEAVRREFVANVSHELRTPLASIRAMVETLEAGAIDDQELAADFLERIVGEVDRLASLVDELLDLGRLESGRVTLKLEPLDPADVLARGAERLRPQTERAGLTLKVDVPEGLPDVLADRGRIEQVLLNLVHNAIKFTPSGGAITVDAAITGDRLIVSVRDTGIGIAPAELPRVFERFYKSDRSRRSDGTGLGLAIAKHIVQAHHGAISVESSPGQGATFSFSLPLATASRTNPRPPEDSASSD
jgi:two-component system phosphate regulon sensor histidine kinase PhoR